MAGREGDGADGPGSPLGQVRHEHSACRECLFGCLLCVFRVGFTRSQPKRGKRERRSNSLHQRETFSTRPLQTGWEEILCVSIHFGMVSVSDHP
jgi:hypothetical protein